MVFFSVFLLSNMFIFIFQIMDQWMKMSAGKMTNLTQKTEEKLNTKMMILRFVITLDIYSSISYQFFFLELIYRTNRETVIIFFIF